MNITIIKNNFVKKDEYGNFSLWLNEPYCSVMICSSGSFFDKNTGENLGNKIYVKYKMFDDNFQLLDEPVAIEDYEWRLE